MSEQRVSGLRARVGSVKTRSVVLLLLAALASLPAGAGAQGSYETVTVTESFPGSPDLTYAVSCDWYDAGVAHELVLQGGSYRVILPGNHGWALCN